MQKDNFPEPMLKMFCQPHSPEPQNIIFTITEDQKLI